MGLNFNLEGIPYNLTLNGKVDRVLRLTQDGEAVDKANEIVQNLQKNKDKELKEILRVNKEACDSAVDLLVLSPEDAAYVKELFKEHSAMYALFVGDLFHSITEEIHKQVKEARKRTNESNKRLAETKNELNGKNIKQNNKKGTVV